MSEDLHGRLTRVFRDVFDEPDLVIEDGHGANEIPAWDSLTHIRLVTAIEEEFAVKLSTADIVAIQTVGEAKQLVGKSLRQ